MRRAASVFAVLLALFSGAACAVGGVVTNLSGAVVAKRLDGQSRILSIKSQVGEGDLIATAENSYARLKFDDGGEVVLRPNTQLRIETYRYDEKRPESDNMAMNLLKGGLRSVTGLLGRRNPAQFKLSTPNATIGIRGTHFGALFCNGDCAGVPMPGGGTPPNGLHIDVADGVIVVSTQAGSAEFRVGQMGYVSAPTVPPVVVPAQQGIRVTLPQQAVTPAGVRGVGAAGQPDCNF